MYISIRANCASVSQHILLLFKTLWATNEVNGIFHRPFIWFGAQQMLMLLSTIYNFINAL